MLFDRRMAGTAAEGDRHKPPPAAEALETGVVPAAYPYHWRAALNVAWENPRAGCKTS
ncbi:MAG: hypothetical protein K2X82_31435 [Gemmataceae bacterium]|nr:hypothetical protein [Gemmataceae bacterium]